MIHAPNDERSSFRWSSRRMFRGARLPGDEETLRPFGWRSVAIPPAPFGTARTPQLGLGAGWYESVPEVRLRAAGLVPETCRPAASRRATLRPMEKLPVLRRT